MPNREILNIVLNQADIDAKATGKFNQFYAII